MSTGAGRLNYQSETGNIKQHFVSEMESYSDFTITIYRFWSSFNPLQKLNFVQAP